MSNQPSQSDIERAKAMIEAEARAHGAGQHGHDDESALFLLHEKASTGAHHIAQQEKGWILAFTRFHRIPVFKRVWVYLFAMTVYTLLVVQFVQWLAAEHLLHGLLKEAGGAAYTSVVMGLLLVFRTNTAYERWSEGRKLWGQLVNDSRNLCFKIRSFVQVPEQDKMQFGQLVISFAFALKHHLRNSVPSEPLPGLGRYNAQDIKNLPVFVCGKIYDLLANWKKAGYVDTLLLIQLDSQLRGFMDICGACERIKNSPIAVSYRAFMRQGIILNLIIVPWLLSEFQLIWCLPMILVGTYFLIGLELIAEDVEEPFGKDGDDLPLDTICATIRTTITDILSLHKSLKYTQTVDSSLWRDPLKTTQNQ